jgi:hypothetical protein
VHLLQEGNSREREQVQKLSDLSESICSRQTVSVWLEQRGSRRVLRQKTKIKYRKGWAQWFIPVISATWEVEIGGSRSKASQSPPSPPHAKLRKTPFQRTS